MQHGWKIGFELVVEGTVAVGVMFGYGTRSSLAGRRLQAKPTCWSGCRRSTRLDHRHIRGFRDRPAGPAHLHVLCEWERFLVQLIAHEANACLLRGDGSGLGLDRYLRGDVDARHGDRDVRCRWLLVDAEANVVLNATAKTVSKPASRAAARVLVLIISLPSPRIAPSQTAHSGPPHCFRQRPWNDPRSRIDCTSFRRPHRPRRCIAPCRHISTAKNSLPDPSAAATAHMAGMTEG